MKNFDNYTTNKFRTKTNKSYICLTLFAILTLLVAGTPVMAAENSSGTINITVLVSAKTIVVIDPDILTWIGGESVNPGEEGIVKAIQIENMGSTNISYLWANTSYEDTSPFGTGNAAGYDAGNFVAMSKANDTNFFFVNRVDYNETHQDIYLNLPANTVSYGRMRDAGNEYFWALESGGVNCTNGTISIGVLPHTDNSSGTTDLSNCGGVGLTDTANAGCRSGDLTAVSSGDYEGIWGWADINMDYSNSYHNYTVAVHSDCNITMFYHWNKDAPGADSATNPEYLSETTLYPGGAVIMYVKVKVPYGTAAGNVGEGFLTITAQST